MAIDALQSRVERIESALLRLAEAQGRTEERLEQLAARVDQLAAHMTQLVDAQTRTEAQIARLARVVGDLKGRSLEAEYRDTAHALFQRVLRRIHLMPLEEVEPLADEAEDRGVLSAHEHIDLMQADVFLHGRQRDRGTEAYLVAEVSAVVDSRDVERATRRAALLARLVSAPVLAAVAGEEITEEADREARSAAVWRLLNGRAHSPDAPVPGST